MRAQVWGLSEHDSPPRGGGEGSDTVVSVLEKVGSRGELGTQVYSYRPFFAKGKAALPPSVN
jgi:hypothetical protein